MYNVDQTDEHLNRQNQILAHVPCLKLNAYTHTRTFFVLIEPMCFYYYHCLPFECEGTMIVVEEESERRAHHYCRQPLMRARSPEPQRQEWKSSTINVIYKKNLSIHSHARCSMVCQQHIHRRSPRDRQPTMTIPAMIDRSLSIRKTRFWNDKKVIVLLLLCFACRIKRWSTNMRQWRVSANMFCYFDQISCSYETIYSLVEIQRTDCCEINFIVRCIPQRFSTTENKKRFDSPLSWEIPCCFVLFGFSSVHNHATGLSIVCC